MVKAGLGGCMGGDNLWIEMVCLPLPALHPLDSERPFFSTATKGEGSDCAGTFTGPLCFQMVLFSCDTVDTQHLPRIRTLLWGSTEGRWMVCRREGRGGVKRQQRGGMRGPERRNILGGRNLFPGNLDSATASSSLFLRMKPRGLPLSSRLSSVCFIFRHHLLLCLPRPTLSHTAISPALSSGTPCAPCTPRHAALFNPFHL